MEIVSVIGVMLAAYSIYYAHRQAARARTAAQQAKDAAEQAKSLLGQNRTIGDLRQAIEQISSLKELHRKERWERALDRYTPLRQLIQAARKRHPGLSNAEQTQLQTAITKLRSMENEVSKALQEEPQDDAQHLDALRLFDTLNSIQSELEAVSSALENEFAVGGRT
jgi:small-conductance mechanosensitive channel